jgi:hypothetical protein
MEVKSLKGLMEIIERAEIVSDRIRALSVKDHDVNIPDVPLPLSLAATEAWLDLVSEYCRKPLLARSKQLLEAREIATATIPADVLERPDSIADVLQGVDCLHEGLHAAAIESIARALTKGIEDAESVIGTFTTASEELNTLADSQKWVVALAAARVAEAPSNANAVVEIARRVVEHSEAAARKGVDIVPFVSLEDAVKDLTQFNTLNQEYDRLLVLEGLSEERVSLSGLSIPEAVDKLLLATAKVRSEKVRLLEDIQAVESQLKMIGGESPDTASTVAELRHRIPRRQELLDERRRIFQTSLGQTAFRVVQSLVEGKLPAPGDVTDEEFGNAIRKAIECGYRFQLEAPRENR